MPRNFVYAPGMPGYGTKGADGSTGLKGVATYFSAYDGNSDSVTIKGKIIANKELFSTNNNLPGYPTRTYQTGDIFIDKNARIFQIDFNENNLYKDTGIYLNTSGFFTEGPTQFSSPGFSRYSNLYETEKFLIDTVYANTAQDYTQYPTTIYNNSPKYYAGVKYVGSDITPDVSDGIYPFSVWTIGSVSSKDSIALMRENTNNAWHFGNLDNAGVVRDVSLSLDFKDIYMPGDLALNGDISIGGGLSTIGNINIGGNTKIVGDVSVNGTIYGTFLGTISTTSLDLSGFISVGTDASIDRNLYVDGSSRVYGNMYGSKNLAITGKSTFTDDVSIKNQLWVTNEVYCTYVQEDDTVVTASTSATPYNLQAPKSKYLKYYITANNHSATSTHININMGNFETVSQAFEVNLMIDVILGTAGQWSLYIRTGSGGTGDILFGSGTFSTTRRFFVKLLWNGRNTSPAEEKRWYIVQTDNPAVYVVAP